MNTRILSALAVALLVGPVSAAAEEGELRPFVEGGVTVPVAPETFRRLWAAGLGVGAGLEYGFNPVAGVWGRLEYARVGLDDDEARRAFFTPGAFDGVSGGEADLWSLHVGLRVRAPSGRLRPYAEVGGGVGRISTSSALVRYRDFATGEPRSYGVAFGSETQVGFSGGIGVLWARPGSFGVYADVHIDVLLTEDDPTQYVPVRVGVLFP